MELTLSEIDNLSETNSEFKQELSFLYKALNDYPITNLESVSELMEDLSKNGLQSFSVKSIQEYQDNLSFSKNAWEIESLESIIAFCRQIDENDFVNAVRKLKQKLRVA